MKFVYAFVFLFISLMILPSSAKANQIENDILSGLNDVYNLRFDEASVRFKQIQSAYPQDLRGFFYESLLYFYKALPSRQQEPYDKFLEITSKVIEMADKALDKNEDNFDAMYYKGLSHSYRSLLMLSLNKDLLEAASNGNEGYRTLTELIEKRPDYYDAYMGLGLYKIALGFVPDKFRWLLSLIGFEGNIRNGVDMLKVSMNKGKFTKVDSKVFLSIFSLNEREQNDNNAVELSGQLVRDFPESSVFKVFHGSLLLQNGMPDEAIAMANEALKINNRSFQDEIDKSASAILGSASFRKNNYQDAIKYLENFMKYANSGDRLNVHMFTLGISYELTGNRQKAIDTYTKVRKDFINERDGEIDKFFYRYARERIKEPLRQYDKDLITAMNLRETGQIAESIKMYGQMSARNEHLASGTDDDKIRLFHNLGLSYSYKGEYQKAEDCFGRCLSLNPETEKWLLPHSYFELGKIAYLKGDKDRSNEYFGKVSDFDDFDFESFLEMRISNFRNKM